MGIIRGGVLGGFRNKTGAVVGSYWRTLDPELAARRRHRRSLISVQNFD
jgi:hypothetical protein